MIDSIILSIVSGLILIFYKWFDSNKNMERHFHQHEILKYYALQFAVIILSFSVFFNGRYIAGIFLKKLWNKFTHHA